ncbi:calcium-binding protein cml37 [Chrysochromulina tobinii]|uniref:Calcium-binding protein cml37 n=1 Tax=Chrysochromulina tobinii TaxID=1460289 RepID=A0A0M0JWU4_9EUKA|nr:calcium-binding protein cml37 [Chrysochromulina tobinii]|eukprot:KOO31010.1 calcium-binding protein cml37 [Chrysochromulina sp. CCMP291]
MNHASVNLDVAAMRTVFQCFDVNKSGGIDLQELQSAVKVLGISINPREVAKMFHAADTDGSGEVDFDEFTAIMHKSDGGAFARMIRKRSRSQLSLHDTQWSRSQLTFHDTHAHPAVGVLYYAN